MGRMEKVNQQLKKEISLIILTELADPRLQFVSITSVDISRDLRHAKVYFSVIGDLHKAELAQQSLDKARGIIRKYVGQRMEMRYTPELVFSYDNSIELAARMEETLKEIRDERKENI